MQLQRVRGDGCFGGLDASDRLREKARRDLGIGE